MLNMQMEWLALELAKFCAEVMSRNPCGTVTINDLDEFYIKHRGIMTIELMNHMKRCGI